jgi:tryptophan-rich sensory protein
MISYVLVFLVITLFVVFAIFQIRKGKDEFENYQRPKWFGILRIVFAIVILIGLAIVGIIVLINL